MGLSDILNRIKAALGIGGTRRQQAPQQPPQQGQYQQSQPRQESGHEEQAGTNVTVEREPSTESEDAVKGTDTESETAPEADTDAETTEETDTESETAAETSQETTESEQSEPSTDDDLGTDESTDVIKGIGSAYADRLAEAGIETVADLAQGDADALSEETGISEKRLQNWVDRAKHR